MGCRLDGSAGTLGESDHTTYLESWQTGFIKRLRKFLQPQATPSYSMIRLVYAPMNDWFYTEQADMEDGGTSVWGLTGVKKVLMIPNLVLNKPNMNSRSRNKAILQLKKS